MPPTKTPNTEYSRKKEDLLTGHAGLASILNISYEAIISIDQHQNIVLFNKGAERIFGYQAEKIIGHPLDMLLPEATLTAHRQHVNDFARSTATTRLMSERREISGRRKDGQIFPAEASISKLEGSEEGILTVVLRDITQRKQAVAEREHLISQLSALNDAARVITAELSLDQVLQEIAEATRKLMKVRFVALGVHDDNPQSPMITSGEDIDLYAEISSWPTKYDLLEPLIGQAKPIIINNIIQHLSDAEFPLHRLAIQRLLGVPIFSKGDMIGVLYLADKENNAAFSVSDWQLVEKLTLHAAVAIENARHHEQTQRLAVLEERDRFARDLHDGIIQSIYAVGLVLDQAKADIQPDNEVARQQINVSLKNLAGVIQDIRNYIFDLRPQAGKQDNLETRLDYLIKEVKANTLLPIYAEIDADACAKLNKWQANHIFHICHESLSNAVRHARPKQIAILLTQKSQSVMFQIADDGTGFELPPQINPGHHGLANIKTRAAKLGATLHIDSIPNMGTTITVTLKPTAK